MAFPMRRQTAAEPPPAQRLQDEPDIRPLAEVLSTLRGLKRRLERERERLALEAMYAENAGLRGYTRGGDRDRQMRARLAELKADTPTKPHAAPVAGDHSPTIAAALALLDGKPAPPPNDRAARRLAVERELLIVDAALREADLAYDDKAEELSARKCESMRPAHDRLNVEIFRAAQQLSRLVDQERAMRAALLVAGYTVRGDIMSPLMMPALLMLGSETQHDSSISTVRRHLEQTGLL